MYCRDKEGREYHILEPAITKVYQFGRTWLNLKTNRYYLYSVNSPGGREWLNDTWSNRIDQIKKHGTAYPEIKVQELTHVKVPRLEKTIMELEKEIKELKKDSKLLCPWSGFKCCCTPDDWPFQITKSFSFPWKHNGEIPDICKLKIQNRKRIKK